MSLNFRPKYEKIVELMLYLAHRMPGVDKYQAVKFFYLADKAHLERYGRPITQEKYVALDYGPVASTVKDFMERDKWTMKKAGVSEFPFAIEEVARPNKRPIAQLRSPQRDVDFDLFSKSDIKVFDEIIERYGKCSFDDLYNITHNHHAYRNVWEHRPRGAKSAAMRYEDMIESPERRKAIIEDMGPISEHV